MAKVNPNFQFQKKLTVFISVLFLVKLASWYLTGSLAILSDTLEYTINLVSSFLTLYSLYLSGLPKDKNHPYGHGKVEFLSATIEGTLMMGSSLFLMFEIARHWLNPHPVVQLNYGLALLALSGLINYGMGHLAISKGKQNHSLALIASGRHMKTDTYATAAIFLGLIFVYFTGWAWIDGLVALIFSGVILVSGYRILRKSIGGIMDEADLDLLNQVVSHLQKVRRPNWIDLHNLRIIQYGGTLHLDCHLTVPWYFNVHEAHEEIDFLDKSIGSEFGQEVEFFVHTDGCLDFSCPICTKTDCPVRKFPFEQKLVWTMDNISSNKKHRLPKSTH